MYFTYIIQSETSSMLYIGQTGNLDDRLLRHNQNRNQFTKNKGPWKLVFAQSFETRAEAVKLETKLKKFKNREYLLKWIQQQNGFEHPDLQSGEQ